MRINLTLVRQAAFDLYADAIDARKYKDTLHSLDIGEKVGEKVEGKTLERDAYPPMIKLCEENMKTSLERLNDLFAEAEKGEDCG